MTRFLLLEGGFSSGNRGIDALTLGCMHTLRASYPAAEFALLEYTYPTTVISRLDLSIGGERLTIPEARTSFHRGAEAVLRTTVTKRPLGDETLRYFWWADAIVDISGGDGFGDTYSTKVLLRHSLGKLMALHLKKPLAILPQTIGPFKTAASRALARYLLRRADLVCVREEISRSIVQDLLGSGTKIFCLPDLAFVMDSAAPASPDPQLVEMGSEARPIGVNVSAFLWHRGHLMSDSQGLAFDYPKMIVGLVRRLVRDTGRRVVLIPHVFSNNPMTSDLTACEAAGQQLGDVQDRLIVLQQSYSAPEIRAVIGQCEFFVGSRMHACISALSTAIPLVPISYSHKFSGILRRFGLNDWLVDPRTCSQQEAANLVLAAYENRDTLRQHILSELPAVKAEAMQVGQLVKSVVG